MTTELFLRWFWGPTWVALLLAFLIMLKGPETGLFRWSARVVGLSLALAAGITLRHEWAEWSRLHQQIEWMSATPEASDYDALNQQKLRALIWLAGVLAASATLVLSECLRWSRRSGAP